MVNRTTSTGVHSSTFFVLSRKMANTGMISIFKYIELNQNVMDVCINNSKLWRLQVTLPLKDTGKACYVTVCLSGSFVNILTVGYKGRIWPPSLMNVRKYFIKIWCNFSYKRHHIVYVKICFLQTRCTFWRNLRWGRL